MAPLANHSADAIEQLFWLGCALAALVVAGLWVLLRRASERAALEEAEALIESDFRELERIVR